MNRLKMKVAAGTLGFGHPTAVDDTQSTRIQTSPPMTRPPSTSPRATSPTSPAYSSSSHSPLARFASHHMRATSASAARSQTPGPPTPIRSQTPSLHSPLRPASVGPAGHGKSRRMSNATSPQKIVRSTSDDKESIHERWIPSIHPDASSPPSSRLMKFAYPSHN
jgi:hypothetical protein